MALGADIRVLVVDDEPSICQAMTMALARAGFTVSSVLSADGAVAVLRSERVDVLLVDLRIPDGRGDVVFEIAAALQPHLRHQTLFMTGDITERGRSLIRACGQPYLQKPFFLADMLSAVVALSPWASDATA
jgi:two-component system OmpR family response regulator